MLGKIFLVGLEPGCGGVIEHQIHIELEQIDAVPEHRLLDRIAVLGEQVKGTIELAQSQMPSFRQPDPLQPALMTGQLRARSLQPLHGHRQQGCEMGCLQLLLGDRGCDRGTDPEPIPQGLDHMRHAELEDRLDLDVADTGTLDHRLAAFLGQDPPDAGHQPLQHGPVEPVGTPEAMHDPGFNVALLGVAGVLGERVVAHHAPVLVPPLGRPQVHAH